MMKHRFSTLIVFTVLLAAVAGALSLKQASASSAPVTLGTFTPPPIVFEETGSYVKLNNSAFIVEFYKDSAGYNKIYNESGAVVVYDERHVLQYWSSQGQGSWKSRGTPYNLTWVKVSDYWYNVTRHYTDYLGTEWNVTFVVKSWEPLKSAVSVDSGQTDTYRISWQLSGVVYTDEASADNRVQFGGGRLGFDWVDVFESFGNITTATVESHAQGRKLTVCFEVGEIAAETSLVLDPTVDSSTSSIATQANYQRSIIYDGTYWWFFYHNGTGYKYKYSSDLSTISGGATVEDVGTGGRAGGISVSFDGSTGIQTFYGPYISGYKLREREGTISGTTISWEDASQIFTDGSYYVGIASVWDGTDHWVAVHRYTGGYVRRYHYTTWWGSDYIDDNGETINANSGGIALVSYGSGGIFNVIQDGANSLRYSTDSNNFGDIASITTAAGHAAFAVVSEGSVVHVAYLDSSDNLKYIRWSGSAWGDIETIMSSAAAYSFPVISLDDVNGKLYVFWGDDTTDDIYWRSRDGTGASGTWDSSSGTVVAESDLVGGDKYGNGRISAPLYFNDSKIPVMYVTGTGSPYSIKIVSFEPPTNADPTITSASSADLKDTDNMYGMDGYYSFQVVVNDEDGATDIDKVYLQAKSGETVRWEVRATSLTGTPSWAIQTGDTIIDITTSSWVEDGNSGTATFEIRAEFDHPGYADLELAVYVEDSAAASAGWTDKQTDYFDVINRLVVESFAVSDTRHNVGGTVTFSGNVRYATTVSGDTASSYYPANALFTGIDIHDSSHSIKASDATVVNGAFSTTSATLSSSVTSTTYHVYLNLAPDFTDMDAPDGDTVAVISDRIEIVSVAFDDTRIDVSGGAEVRYVLRYDYDDVAFEGTDGSIVGFTWDGVNSWWDKAITGSASVTSTTYDENDLGAITDSNYGLTALEDDAGANIVTDRVKVIATNRRPANPGGTLGDNRINLNRDISVYFELRYEHDNLLMSDGTVTIEGVSATYILQSTWGKYCWSAVDTGSATVTSRVYDEFTVSGNTYGITAVNQNGQSETIIWDRIEIVSVAFSDSRINIGGSSEVRYVLRYDYDDVQFDSGKGSITGFTWDSGNSWWDKAITGSGSVGSENYDENDLGSLTDSTYGLTQWEDDAGANIITDRVEIYYEAVNDSLVLKDENIEYRIKARLDYDNHELGSGDSVTANSGAMAWDAGNGWFDDQRTQAAVGSYLFDVTAASEDTYGITSLYDPQSSPTGYWKDTPNNDAADSDATFDVDVYGWVNVTVTDEDGVANLATVEVQMTTSGSEVFTLRWTQSSGVFSEQSDANGVCTLDASGSTRVNVDADTDKIGFRFKVSAGAQMGAVSVQATTTDDDGYSDQDNYGSEFSINWYAEITIDDGSHSWSSLSPGDSQQTLDAPVDTDIDVTVSSNGAFDLQGKVNQAPTSGGYTIPLSNLVIHEDTVGSAAALTTGYVDIGGLTSQSRGLSLAKSFKLWLTVPNPQQGGSYTYTLSVQVATP